MDIDMDIDKLRELIVYITSEGADDPRLGAIKMNKILYYSDFYAYRALGQSITGATYQHLEEGPAPKELLAARESLIEDGSIRLERVQYYNRVQDRVFAQRDARLDRFSQEEIDKVNEVIVGLRPYNASEVTEMSHKEIGWRVTELGETIPYNTAWLSAQPLTDDQVSLGKKIAEWHGYAKSSVPD